MWPLSRGAEEVKEIAGIDEASAELHRSEWRSPNGRKRRRRQDPRVGVGHASMRSAGYENRNGGG